MPLDHVALRFSRDAEHDLVEAIYTGVRYRSELHARWAVFFGTLGIDHAYQPRSFRLGGDVPFTPDFWLPSLNAWLVVKPADPEMREAERWKVDLFAREHAGVRVWISSGAPRPGEWHVEQLGSTPLARGMLLVDASAPAERIWICGSNDGLATQLVVDAIEIGSGKSVARPDTFPADPNTSSVMRMAYGQLEHFYPETWTPIGAAGRDVARGTRSGSLWSAA